MMEDEKAAKRLVPVNEGFIAINDAKYKEKEHRPATPIYEEYRRKWVDNAKNFIVGKAPLHIDIEVTNACNLKCSMCIRTVNLQRGEKPDIGFMDFDLYKKIIDEASDIGVYSVKLFWRGEPLIDKRIVDRVKYAKEKGIIDVDITTNGILLTEELSRGLIEAGLNKLAFSFDSPYKEKYEAIRVGADFDKTLNNIRRFSEIRNEMRSETPLTRAAIVSIETKREELDAYNKLFSEIVDAVHYHMKLDYSSDSGNEEVIIEKIRKCAVSCPQPWQRLAVTWDGTYTSCCCDHDSSYILGSAKELSVSDVWLGEKLNALRDAHMNGSWIEIDLCRRCQSILMNAAGYDEKRMSGNADGAV